MSKEKIILAKLKTGEMIVGEKKGEKLFQVALLMPTPKSFIFIDYWKTASKEKEPTISVNCIMVETEPLDDLVMSYRQWRSNISVAKKPLIQSATNPHAPNVN